MRTDIAESYRRIGGAVGMAMNSYSDRIHFIGTPDPDKVIQRAECGRQVVEVMDPTGLSMCRECWPAASPRPLDRVWDICDDLDGRYNGTIRDERPLGSIFDG